MSIDLISREAAIDELQEELDLEAECKFGKISAADAFAIAIRRVKKLPAVDAEPVRHGKWLMVKVTKKYGGLVIRCPECDAKGTRIWNWCPNCGVKMDDI